MRTPRERLIGLALLSGALGLGIALWVPPVPQWPEYHDFADRRVGWGIPNALDVLSNGFFTLVGLAGLWRIFAARHRLVFLDKRERWPWAVFFLALVLLGPASAAYHLAPDNAGLAWDRLAMTAVLMSWLATHFVERIGLRVGLYALPALLAMGVAAVLYWRMSELAGAGDLRAYGMVHFYPALLVPLLMALLAPRYDRWQDTGVALGLYGAALVAELLDRQVFALTGMLSGHTLKHLLSALAAGWLLYGLRLRKPVNVE